MVVQEFWVNGMTCVHCERAITAELARLPSVVEVHVDAASGRVRISHEGVLSWAAVGAAVDDAGYELRAEPAVADG